MIERNGLRATLVLLVAALVAIAGVNVPAAVADRAEYSVVLPPSERDKPATRVLVLFPDDEDAGASRDRETFLSILGSHWHLAFERTAFAHYHSGDLAGHDVALVLSGDAETMPQRLLHDLAGFAGSPGKRVVWLGPGPGAREVTGMQAIPVHTRNLPVSRLSYKGIEFSLRPNKTLRSVCDSPLTAMVEHLAMASTPDGSEIPYACLVSGRHLVIPTGIPWYYDIDNGSWVFLDVLHRAFGHHHDAPRTALVRLEDVNVKTYEIPDTLQAAYDFLLSSDTPFHIALIPRYVNPDTGDDLLVNDRRRFFHILKRMIGEGLATPVQHGYTHQYDGVSGLDFEFWDETTNAPVERDSMLFVVERITAARDAMREAGLPVPDVWETPHYAASSLDYDVFRTFYPALYEAVPDIGSLPFAAKIDGTVYIPENLGYISPGAAYTAARDLDGMDAAIERALVFEDPVLSFFWHPWRDVHELEHIVRSINGKGHAFRSLYSLVERGRSLRERNGLIDYRDNYRVDRAYHVTNAYIYFIFAVFLLGAAVFFHRAIKIGKYLSRMARPARTASEVRALAERKGTDLPRFVILVPARNESLVIENTVRCLADLNYPKDRYRVLVVVDERERADGVETMTRDVVEAVGAEINRSFGVPLVNCLEVQEWYSGLYGSDARTHAKSTKGRALNYALQHINGSPEWKPFSMLGVLDADGRPHRDVLNEAAYEIILHGSRLLQGPVFQVSNFDRVSLTGVCAGLELAVHHLTDLPSSLERGDRVQFLAGTNYYIDRKLLGAAGGWDANSLVEDAELAFRLFARTGVTARWLGCPEIEQTPACFAVYRRQRERWVRGQLLLLGDIVNSGLIRRDKLRLAAKIVTGQFRFFFDLTLSVSALVLFFIGYLADLGVVFSALSIFLMFMTVIMWNLFGFMYLSLSRYYRNCPTGGRRAALAAKLFFFYPLFMLSQSVPRIQGLWNAVSGRHDTWYKTERTAEIPVTAYLRPAPSPSSEIAVALPVPGRGLPLPPARDRVGLRQRTTTVATRAEIIARVVFGGESMRSVGRNLGFSDCTVRRWVARYKLEGEAGLLDRRVPRRTSRSQLVPMAAIRSRAIQETLLNQEDNDASPGPKRRDRHLREIVRRFDETATTVHDGTPFGASDEDLDTVHRLLRENGANVLN